MQKNKELQELFNNYRNLSEEQLIQLLGLVIKQEKDKMRLSFPVRFEVNYDEVNDNYAGGDFSLEYNEKEKRHEYVIRLNGKEWYAQYLANRNKTLHYKTMEFDSSMDSLYHLIAQVCHEMRHAYQTEVGSVRKDITDDNALTWLKEYLSITDSEFYRKNYSNMSREVDAFDYQFKEALEFIKTYTSIEIDNPNFFADLQHQQERWNKENVKPIKELTFDVDGKQMKITDYFHQHMPETFKKQGITSEMLKTSILRYEYNPDGTKKTLEQLIQDKKSMIDSLDKTLSNYDRQVERIERIYDSIIQNDSELQLQSQQSKETNERQPGYSREESGTSITERQQQVLKDYSGQEIGHRIITSTYDMEKGTELIDTVGEIENEDGTYKICDEQQGYGGELQLQRKEITKFNKLTSENEQYVYQKDKDGNEMYYKSVNGKLRQRITKNNRGTIIDNYEDGQLTDSYEYDENGNALIGMDGIDSIDDDYVEKYFDAYIPYFDAENRNLPEFDESYRSEVLKTIKEKLKRIQQYEQIEIKNRDNKEDGIRE